jgi:hypothetical protein
VAQPGPPGLIPFSFLQSRQASPPPPPFPGQSPRRSPSATSTVGETTSHHLPSVSPTSIGVAPSSPSHSRGVMAHTTGRRTGSHWRAPSRLPDPIKRAPNHSSHSTTPISTHNSPSPRSSHHAIELQSPMRQFTITRSCPPLYHSLLQPKSITASPSLFPLTRGELPWPVPAASRCSDELPAMAMSSVHRDPVPPMVHEWWAESTDFSFQKQIEYPGNPSNSCK